MTSLHSCFENEASIVKFVIIKSFTQLIWQSKNNCMLCKARICSSQASVSTSFPRDSYIQTRSKCNSRILHIIELAKQEELHALQAGIRPSLREFEIKIHVNCPYKKMVGTEAPASVSTSFPWDYHIPYPIFTLKYIITLHQM